MNFWQYPTLLFGAVTLCGVFKVAVGLATGGRWGPVMYCPECGLFEQGLALPRGYLGMELLLWCCGLLPGLLYSVWRVRNPQRVCVSCHFAGIVPLDSPLALAASAVRPASRL